ncbi:unnamed protein product [Sphagnum troendelagicum]|uniref:Uncharacterized protein n=1 Tax=Sphagnum troendelagicum TaxID=128251 RepID=A0ABP0U589_9BRYO
MLISVRRSGTTLSVRGFSNFNWNEAYRPREDTATRRGVCSICAHGSLAALHSFDKKNLQSRPMQPKNCTVNGVPLGSCKQLSHGPVIIPSKSVCMYDIHLLSFTMEQPDFIQTSTSQEPPSSLVYLMDHARRQDMVMISSVIQPQINPSRPDVQPSINLNPEPDLTPPVPISPTPPTTNPDVQPDDVAPSEVPASIPTEVATINPVPIPGFDPSRDPDVIPGPSLPSESPVPSTPIEIPSPMPVQDPPPEYPSMLEISPRMQVAEAAVTEVPQSPPISPQKVTPHVPPGIPKPTLPPQTTRILPPETAPSIPLPQTPITPPNASTTIPRPTNPPPGTPPLTPKDKPGPVPPPPPPPIPEGP